MPDNLHDGRPRVSATCTECEKDYDILKQSLKANLKKNGQYLCKDCALRKAVNSESFQSKLRERNRNQSKETREKIQQTLQSRYSSQEMREECKKRSEKAWEDPEFRARQMNIVESHEFKIKLSQASKKAWSDSSRIASHSKRMVELWKSPEFRSKQMDSKSSTIYRDRQSQKMKEKWRDSEYRKSQVIKLTDAFKDGHDSYLERAVQSILESVGIKYVRHHPIAWYEFDLFLPDHGMLIKCQGEYWHSKPEAKARDARKWSFINNNFPGLKILYLYERDFLNPNIVKRKIINALSGSLNEKTHSFNLNQVSISDVSMEKSGKSAYSVAEEFLQAFHYAGYGRTAKRSYGGMLEGILVAVCKFSRVIRAEVATSIGSTHSHVLELDRFCIHPSYQKKNFASWFLTRCIRLIWSSFPDIHHIVAFSDTTFGHVGTIYKAAGWRTVSIVKPDYHYVDPDGFILHKKTLYNHAVRMGMKEKEYVNRFRYVMVFGKEKIKYVLSRPRVS